MLRKTDELASDLYDKIARASGENARLRRVIKNVQKIADDGLLTASGDGAVAWRDALQKIAEMAKRN